MKQDPLIGNTNYFQEGTVSVTTEDADFPKENAYDEFTDDFWKPTADGTQRISVDMGVAVSPGYAAIAAHDLFTQGGSFRIQHSDDGVAWTNYGSEITPADNSPILRKIDGVSARYWGLRFVTAGGNIFALGVAAIGLRIDIPIGYFGGYAPPRLNPQDIRLNSTSEGGQFIGTSLIRTGIEDKLELDPVSPSWARTTWKDFADRARKHAFFVAWYPTEYPDEVIYCWRTSPPSASNSGLRKGYMAVSMSMRGIAE